MVCWTRSGGKRRRDRPRWPGCPPVCLPVRFLTTGLGAWGGLDDGGREELEAFCPRRAWRSRTVCSNWAMRSSSSAQREQFGTGSLIAPLYQHEAGPIPLAANRLSGYLKPTRHRRPCVLPDLAVGVALKELVRIRRTGASKAVADGGDDLCGRAVAVE